MVVVLKSVLNPAQLAQLRALLDPALFSAGDNTAYGMARLVKNNQQIAATHPVGAQGAETVLVALNQHGQFRQMALPVRMTPPIFNLYREGMAYGRHTDAALMDGGGVPMRSDFSMTIFLSEPSEYDGGELVFTGPDGVNVTAKLDAGQAVLYPSNTLHEVRPVTRGARLACIVWVQSAVADAAQREALLELDRVRAALEEGNIAVTRERLVLAKENLIRLFARP